MTPDPLFTDRVTRIVASRLKVWPDEVKPDATLVQLGADSISHLEIVMDLEDEFSVDITDDEAENLKTVGQLLALVGGKLQVMA
jgi:acyl carrier protein